MMRQRFDTLIVIAEKDFDRVSRLYYRLKECLECRRIIFVGNESVGKQLESLNYPDYEWLDENSILPFDEVHELMKRRLALILNGRDLPRGVTGWYYQQFLKMKYADFCQDEYYMIWDGDTIPCKKISMYSADEHPYLDYKEEYKQAYFDTMGKLIPGLRKVIRPSFISEHMLIKKQIMNSLIKDIEGNESIQGNSFWEKILYAIDAESIQNAEFSEFETYGSYAAIRYTDTYRLREWHSFRLGAEYFDPKEITDADFEWLGRDFHAISFEKGQSVRADHQNLFNNPEYQKKLSAKRMLLEAQKEYIDGYKEKWADEIEEEVNETGGITDTVIENEDPDIDDGVETKDFWKRFDKYRESINGEYGMVSVEGLTYISYASDLLIMGTMYNTGINWARDDMWRFFRLSEKYYGPDDRKQYFLDIGANIGTTGIYFKKKIDPEVNIIAFEPSRENYRMLQINMQLNGIDKEQYCLEELALSDKSGEAVFSYNISNSGGSRLVSGNGAEGTVTVNTIRFDDYVAQKGIDVSQIKYIWVDVEGAEPLFLRGARDILSEIRVPMVMEFSPKNYKESGNYMECVDLLYSIYDYFIYMHDTTDTLHPIDELYRYEDAEQLVDLFLVKKECIK